MRWCPQEDKEKQHPWNGRTQIEGIEAGDGVSRCGCPANEWRCCTCDPSNDDVLWCSSLKPNGVNENIKQDGEKRPKRSFPTQDEEDT